MACLILALAKRVSVCASACARRHGQSLTHADSLDEFSVAEVILLPRRVEPNERPSNLRWLSVHTVNARLELLQRERASVNSAGHLFQRELVSSSCWCGGTRRADATDPWRAHAFRFPWPWWPCWRGGRGIGIVFRRILRSTTESDAGQANQLSGKRRSAHRVRVGRPGRASSRANQ